MRMCVMDSSSIQNSPKKEATQISISWWMDKQDVVYLYNGLLFCYEKEWSTDTRNRMDVPWKYHAACKKPVK
jgi:hypothetical protein